MIEIQEEAINNRLNSGASHGTNDPHGSFAESERAAEAKARKELRELYRLVEMGDEEPQLSVQDLAVHENIGLNDRQVFETLVTNKGNQILGLIIASGFN